MAFGHGKARINWHGTSTEDNERNIAVCGFVNLSRKSNTPLHSYKAGEADEAHRMWIIYCGLGIIFRGLR